MGTTAPAPSIQSRSPALSPCYSLKHSNFQSVGGGVLFLILYRIGVKTLQNKRVPTALGSGRVL